VDKHLQSVTDKAGRVDISFNAVGIPDTRILGVPLVELDVEQFSLPIATYTRSYFLTARLAARHMIRNKSGVIMRVTALHSRTGALADRLNSKPKYVVSSTLQDPAWNNTTVLKGNVVNEVSKLKQQLAGDIIVPASFQLVRTLIEHDLADELRLMIYPVVLGAGERLFGETSNKKAVRLVDTQTVEGDVLFLTYEFVREA